MNRPGEEQDEEYAAKLNFIQEIIPTDTNTLDYGCGVGRYAPIFDPEKYLGVDITSSLLQHARKTHPDYRFVLLEDPWLPHNEFEPELVFTATVLQHNDDAGVRRIIDSWPATKIVALYENTSNFPSRGHMAFRTPEDYQSLIKERYTVHDTLLASHVVHNEEHTLMLFYV